MNSERIHLIAKRWLAVALVLALLLWVGVAGAARATPSLDQQLIEAAGSGDLSLVKRLLDRGPHADARGRDAGIAVMSTPS